MSLSDQSLAAGGRKGGRHRVQPRQNVVLAIITINQSSDAPVFWSFDPQPNSQLLRRRGNAQMGEVSLGSTGNGLAYQFDPVSDIWHGRDGLTMPAFIQRVLIFQIMKIWLR
jgi:hypothetical protein